MFLGYYLGFLFRLSKLNCFFCFLAIGYLIAYISQPKKVIICMHLFNLSYIMITFEILIKILSIIDF